MDLTTRQLAFLEYEMGAIMESDDRTQEEKSHASSVLGRVEGEIEWQSQDKPNTDSDPDALFAGISQ